MAQNGSLPQQQQQRLRKQVMDSDSDDDDYVPSSGAAAIDIKKVLEDEEEEERKGRDYSNTSSVGGQSKEDSRGRGGRSDLVGSLGLGSDSDSDDGASDLGDNKSAKDFTGMDNGEAIPKANVGSGIGGESSGQDGDDDDDGEPDDDDSSIRKGGIGGGGGGGGGSTALSANNPSLQQPKSTMQALFGSDDEDDDDDDDDGNQNKRAGGLGSGDEDRRGGDASRGDGGRGGGGGGGADSDNEMVEELEDEDIQLPSLPQLPDGIDHYVARITSILGVKSERFDPATYEGSETAEMEAKEFRTRNIIRWRYKEDENGQVVKDAKDGGPIPESNTRLVKWSDGSMQLFIGNEAYDVDVHSTEKRSFLFAQQLTQRGTSCLECQSVIPNRLSFKPVGLDSKVHRDNALRVKSKQITETGIQRHAEAADPEKLKLERIKQQEEAKRREKRKSKTYSRYGVSSRRPGMEAGFLEEEEERDYDTVGLRNIKDSVKKGRYDFSDESDDDDESEKDDSGAGGASSKGAAAASVSQRDRDQRAARRHQGQLQQQDSDSETGGFQHEDDDSGKEDGDGDETYGAKRRRGGSSGDVAHSRAAAADGGGGGEVMSGGSAAAEMRSGSGGGGGGDDDSDDGGGAGMPSSRSARATKKRKLMVDSDSD